MKTKIRTLKRDIDRYLPLLQKKYPMSTLVSSAVESLLGKDMDDDIIKNWYNSLKRFIGDIEKEIKKIDDEMLSRESLALFKKQMDKHYDTLQEKHQDFFRTLYRFVENMLEEEELQSHLKDAYKNIYSSVQIIKEDIDRLEKESDSLR